MTYLLCTKPNDNDKKENGEAFWTELQDQVEEYIVVGYMNGRLGNDYETNERVVGRYGERTKNSNGRRIIFTILLL